jgi:hypothetical protein
MKLFEYYLELSGFICETVYVWQKLPLRLSAPPLKLGEADFNQKRINLLSLQNLTPSLF